MMIIVICGTLGYSGIIGAWGARQRNRNMVRGFFLGALLAPLFPFGSSIRRYRSLLEIPEFHIFTADYFLLWLLVLSLLNALRLTLQIG
jgi:hypothetical protein